MQQDFSAGLEVCKHEFMLICPMVWNIARRFRLLSIRRGVTCSQCLESDVMSHVRHLACNIAVESMSAEAE